MQINSSYSYNTGTSYSIKLSDRELLVSEEDPLRKKNTKSEQLEKDLKEKKELENSKPTNELSQDEEQMLSQLQARDTEVRAHEAAHQSGGGSTGGASFTYQQGPDGKMYAIGGEVPISMSGGSTPQETIANARAVIASALAPADPSGQDQAVASSAMMMIAKAQQQLAKDTQDKLQGQELYKNEGQQDNSANSNNDFALEKIDISA